MPQKLGSATFGVDVDVTETRAVAFGLDGSSHVHSTAGTMIIYGDLEVTGDVTVGGTTSTDLSAMLDALGV